MKIIWNGHSCFTLQSAQGTVVIDPFADNYVPGCGTIRPEADAVYCSHGRERTHVEGLNATTDLLLAYLLEG